MKSQPIVLDANVAIKILCEEEDSYQAKEFFYACTQNGITLLAPEHFIYELMTVCHQLGIKAEHTLEFYDSLTSSIMTIVKPSSDMWLLAEEISLNGHEKSGFPSMYDSIYHATAVQTEGLFVTADKRHFAKTEKYGHIRLLKDAYNTVGS